jgi:hypothetical protein
MSGKKPRVSMALGMLVAALRNRFGKSTLISKRVANGFTSVAKSSLYLIIPVIDIHRLPLRDIIYNRYISVASRILGGDA